MPQFYVKYLLLLFIGISYLPQKGKSQNIDLMVDFADELYEKEDYYGSIDIYQKAVALDSNQMDVLFKYGRALCKVNNYQLATRYLKRASMLDIKGEIEELPYLTAEAYRSLGSYKQAKRFYNKALRPYRDNKEGYRYKRIAVSRKANEWASRKTTNDLTGSENLGKIINSTFSEYGATVRKDELYFSAMIADSLGLGNIIKDEHFFSRIYQIPQQDSTQKIELTFDLESQEIIKEQHVSNPNFFQNELYFSLCDTNFRCEVWRGEYHNSTVRNIKRLNNNINSSSSTNTQAHVVQEGDEIMMYFVSDRSQGFGGLDIWRAKKESFGFGQAVNLGSEINTPGNEITPFFDTLSQSLFFSSDWHLGYGGYDVFQSQLAHKVFQQSDNAGYGVNSSYNDYYFQPYLEEAILSSNRVQENVDNGNSCCNDLYRVTFERKKYEEKPVVIPVDEEKLNKFLPLSLYFHNDSPNPNSKDTSTSLKFDDLAREYITMKSTYREMYLPTLEEQALRSKKSKELNYFFDSTMVKGLKELEKVTPLILKELKNDHFLTLSIRGFASSISNTSYNLTLTSRRIESLINYFKSKGFGPYIESGHLSFNRMPFGEFAIGNTIDEEDRVTAVYSLEAIKERKIEIIAVQSTDTNTLMNVEKTPELQVKNKSFSVIAQKGDVIKRGFLLENLGKADLKIYQVVSNLETIQISYPKLVEREGRGQIIVEVDTGVLNDMTQIELLLVSNDQKNNLLSLKIDIRFTN